MKSRTDMVDQRCKLLIGNEVSVEKLLALGLGTKCPSPFDRSSHFKKSTNCQVGPSDGMHMQLQAGYLQ